MSDNRNFDRFTAEQLLRGEPTSAHPVSELLAAATQPAHPGELTGEDAAVAAFRKAPRTGEPSRTQTTASPARALRLTAAAVLLAAAGAGAAVANGVMRGSHPGAPAIQTGHAAPTSRASSATSGGSATSRSSRVPPRTASSTPVTPPGPTTVPPSRPAKKSSPGPASRPSPTRGHVTSAASLIGLCRAYQQPMARDVRFLRSPAFATLAARAGGPARVQAYCYRLLTQAAPGTLRPSRQFSTPPSDHRSGRPIAHPSLRPTTSPTGHRATVPPPRFR